MTTQRRKTEKIDLNPTRVQNPYEHLKRSPGKFDQKVSQVSFKYFLTFKNGNKTEKLKRMEDVPPVCFRMTSDLQDKSKSCNQSEK